MHFFTGANEDPLPDNNSLPNFHSAGGAMNVGTVPPYSQVAGHVVEPRAIFVSKVSASTYRFIYETPALSTDFRSCFGVVVI